MGHHQKGATTQSHRQKLPCGALAFLPSLRAYGAPKKDVCRLQHEIADLSIESRICQPWQIQNFNPNQARRGQSDLKSRDRGFGDCSEVFHLTALAVPIDNEDLRSQ